MKSLAIAKSEEFFFVSAGLLMLAGALVPPLAHESAARNLYIVQADAFLQGHTDVPPHPGDIAAFDGRHYVPFPPFPAVLLMPVVAILGVEHTNTVVISALLTVLSACLLARILRALDVEKAALPWMLAAFYLGTAYWLSFSRSTGVWYFAHIVAVTAMFLAIHESLGKGRGPLAGLFLGLAFLARQLSIYSFVFIAAALWANPRFSERRSRVMSVVGCAVSLGFCVGAYLAFNYVRFGNPFDTGYGYIDKPDFLQARTDGFGLFHAVYVPHNFINMFLQGFHIEFLDKMYLWKIRMNPIGTSITFASPFVYMAFLARWRSHLLLAAWTAIALSLLHMLLYYNNGWAQTNAQRFTLDFLPILILLVALGTKRAPAALWKTAIGYSVILNIIALLCVPLLGRIALIR